MSIMSIFCMQSNCRCPDTYTHIRICTCLHASPVQALDENVSRGQQTRKTQEEHHDWLFVVTGIDRAAGLGTQRSRFFRPDFPFIQALSSISTILLVYVALVVQVEVGFYWHEGLCALENGPLQRFDVFVDCFFILVRGSRTTHCHDAYCHAVSVEPLIFALTCRKSSSNLSLVSGSTARTTTVGDSWPITT